ncbi:hypothetical protein ACB316_20015 [Aeromonas sanarellii]
MTLITLINALKINGFWGDWLKAAIARSGCLSELSVSSQVHLPDNKKARWGQRAFSLGS